MFFNKRFVFVALCSIFFSFHLAHPMLDVFSCCSSCDVCEEKKSDVSDVSMAVATRGEETGRYDSVSYGRRKVKKDKIITHMAVAEEHFFPDFSGEAVVGVIARFVCSSLVESVLWRMNQGKGIDEDVIKDVFLSTDSKVIKMVGCREDIKTSSTASLVLVDDKKIYFSWVGDTQIFCGYKNGSYWDTSLHSFREYTEKKYFGHKAENEYLDNDITAEPAYGEAPRKDVRFIVVATSILWKTLLPKDVCLCVQNLLDRFEHDKVELGASAASIIAKQLLEKLKKRDKETLDDVTIGVMLF